MKEFGIGQAKSKLLVVACEPLEKITAVDPEQFPHASNALAFIEGGGQVIFHGTEVCTLDYSMFERMHVYVGAWRLVS